MSDRQQANQQIRGSAPMPDSSAETKTATKNNPAETTVKIERDTERWEVEVKAEIPTEILLTYRDNAVKEIQKTAKLDGFRPGHAPESEIIRVYGEPAILRHAAEDAVQHELPEILASQKLPIVQTPHVTINAPEEGKPLSFTARAALAPEIKLPDYKEIAKKHLKDKKEATVSDEEHAKAMTHLRRERARIEKVEAGKKPAEAADESRAMEEKDLPQLDDAFAISIGYESIAHFHTKVRENMKAEKERQATDTRRQAIIEELVKNSKINYPAILREYEINEMEARLKDDLAGAGMTLEAYLAQIKKTWEQILTEWKAPSDTRAKTRLILGEIARIEKIEPDEAQLAQEVEHAKKHYKDAAPEALRAHIAHAMRNEAVLKFLESLEAKK
ncbi:MAG: trigger factor [bacterium]|nr:trigger factor [bacterium]